MSKPNEKQKKEVKKLAKKHFINLKIKEILIVFICIPFIIFIPYYVGLLIGEENCINFNEMESLGSCSLVQYWFTGFITLIFGSLFIIVIGGLIYFGIRTWIRYNWEKAYEKAEKDIGVDSEEYYCEDFKEYYK